MNNTIEQQVSREWFKVIANNQNIKWDWDRISRNSNLTWEIVCDNPDKPWNWYALSSHSNITWNIIQSNPDKPWDWRHISSNPNITWKIIKANPDKPWDWSEISENPMTGWRKTQKNELKNKVTTKKLQQKDINQNVNVMCEFCEKRNKLTYKCENCNYILCEDCKYGDNLIPLGVNCCDLSNYK